MAVRLDCGLAGFDLEGPGVGVSGGGRGDDVTGLFGRGRPGWEEPVFGTPSREKSLRADWDSVGGTTGVLAFWGAFADELGVCSKKASPKRDSSSSIVRELLPDKPAGIPARDESTPGVAGRLVSRRGPLGGVSSGCTLR